MISVSLNRRSIFERKPTLGNRREKNENENKSYEVTDQFCSKDIMDKTDILNEPKVTNLHQRQQQLMELRK